jgi:hypothetical protein
MWMLWAMVAGFVLLFVALSARETAIGGDVSALRR